MWFAVLLLVATADAGTPSPAPVPSTRDAAAPTKPERRTLSLSSVDGAPEFRDVVSGASTAATASAPRAASTDEPSTRVEVREPDPSFDAGLALRADTRAAPRPEATATAATPSPSSEVSNQALLDQSRAQTEALQALLTQQQAQEQARLTDQQGRTERAAAVQDIRDSIGGSVQGLQTSGNWDPSSLSQASASLRRTAASATASGSVGEASRASEAAGLVDAAQAALNQRNAQQAQWYLTRASQLLGEAPPPAGRGY